MAQFLLALFVCNVYKENKLPNQKKSRQMITKVRFNSEPENEGFTNEEKWETVLLPTEGEARVGNNTLIPRAKPEVLMF